MTTATPWLGTKRVAFVPLFRSNAAPPDQILPNWENLILNRVINNPRPEAGGADRSLRAWLQTVSWRKADIEPLVLPMQTIDRQVVEPWDLDKIPWEGVTLGEFLRNQGVHAAQLVMLGGRGAGTSAGFWSRVVMAESNGVWLMELIHSLTGFADLYAFANDTDPSDRNIGLFDEMSAATQTHPTAFTKNELGWLKDNFIGRYRPETVDLRGFIFGNISTAPENMPDQPAGGVWACRIGEDVPYYMVESRKKTDQFETGMPPIEAGIPSEGVIVYRVQTRNPTSNEREGGKIPLFLLTKTALRPGESITLDNKVKITVSSETPKGFIVHMEVPTAEPEIPEGNTIVPNVRGQDFDTAFSSIESAGLVPVGDGDGAVVTSQNPSPNARVARGSTVKFHLRHTGGGLPP